MPSYWVTFKKHKPHCVEAENKESALVAARMALGDPIKAEILPYPAEPRLIMKKYKDPNGHEYNIPSFCYCPNQCKGNTSCQQRYSCTE